jgi:hypothetical protein
MNSSTNNNSNKNKKVRYQLWTDGRGSFAVKMKDSQLFEYSNSQVSYSKLIDSKMFYDGSINKELVKDWIEELKKMFWSRIGI